MKYLAGAVVLVIGATAIGGAPAGVITMVILVQALGVWALVTS